MNCNGRFIVSVFVIMLVFAISLAPQISFAAQPESADRSLSPYFFVKSEDPSVDKLPLKSTSAEVNIAGVIADVKVTQVYKNEGKQPLEAIYIFPGSTRAAVYGMKMTIGERTIISEIKEKNQARQDYEQAKKQGKSASLLEQHRPNVFQMNVANILPGDVIKVEMSYTELLVPTEGIYEFVYPTVVGPRYVGQQQEGAKSSPENWTANPYLHEGEDAPYDFDISSVISAGIPIQEVLCTSHKVNVAYKGPALAEITLDSTEKKGGNRDYILKYRLAGGKIESGLLLYEGKDENFFLAMIQPPKRVSKAHIPGREYIFIVDVSGSMNGFPLDISKTLLKDLIGNLRSTDIFNVILFAGGSTLMSPHSLPASQTNINQAINVIDRQRGGGGTQLLPAMQRALALPTSENFSRTFVIVTDGYISVEEEVFDLMRRELGAANMFSFGIGSSVNRFLIEGMARIGLGEPFVVSKPEEAAAKAEALRKMIESPVLTGINIDYGHFGAYDVEPPSIPDVLAQRPVIVFGKWRGKAKGDIVLTGVSGGGDYRHKINVSKVKPMQVNSAVKYLWARHRISVLGDYNMLRANDKRITEITELGLKYNLLTAYTSFVAIDNQVRLIDGKAVTVKQPLPLPAGVSDMAVGGNARVKSMALPASPSVKGLGAMKQYVGGSEVLTEEERPVCKDEMRREVLKPAKRTVRLGIDKIEADDGLNRKEIKKILSKNLPELNKCLTAYGAAGKGNGKPSLKIKIQIDANGKIVDLKILGNDFSDMRLSSCVSDALRQIVFKSIAKDKSKFFTIVLTAK